MKPIYFAITLLLMVFFGYHQLMSMDHKNKPMKDHTGNTASAVFAGGCFWCTESDFEKVDGVIEAISGYTGGDSHNPTLQGGLRRRYRPHRGREGDLRPDHDQL